VLSATASSGLPISTRCFLSGDRQWEHTDDHGRGFRDGSGEPGGNAQFFSAAPVSQTFTVNMASTALMLTSNSNPALLNQPVTIAATIMPQNGGQASGTITFEDSATILAVVAVTGNVATLTVGSFAVGVHSSARFTAATPTFSEARQHRSCRSLVKPDYHDAGFVERSCGFWAGDHPDDLRVVTDGHTHCRVQVLDGTTVLAQLTLKAGLRDTARGHCPQVPPALRPSTLGTPITAAARRLR